MGLETNLWTNWTKFLGGTTLWLSTCHNYVAGKKKDRLSDRPNVKIERGPSFSRLSEALAYAARGVELKQFWNNQLN